MLSLPSSVMLFRQTAMLLQMSSQSLGFNLDTTSGEAP